MWTSLVELVGASIFIGAQVTGGSLGAGVVLVSTVVRLALLPLILRSARHARLQQIKIQELQPQLARLKARYTSDQRKLIAETQALYKAHGVQLLGGASVASMLIQLPLLGALFSAVRTGLGARVRFLWIADLSRADLTLALLVTGLTAYGMSLAPSTPGSPISPRTLTLVAAGATLVFLWSASSAVALSVGAGSAVSVLQNWLLRREARAANA